MSVTVEWIEEPHIAQITYQGMIQVDDILHGWDAVESLYRQSETHPFCLLMQVLPDRELPMGLLKLATHPGTRFLRPVDAASIAGVDHFLMGILTELLSRLEFCPPIHQTKSYNEALTYLQQVVRAQQAGL
jgi:hypothetical protein